MLLTTLPIDLIYDILLMLEDRKTLAAFVSSNKYLNQAFKTHPNAALRQVVCNEIGMNIHVLPYAWAYLKCLGDALVLGNVATPVTHISPDIEDSLTTGVSSYYLMGLREVHDFVNIMAKYYSVRFKEGRVLYDTLTVQESRNFHCAAYLFSCYQTIWRKFQVYYLDPANKDCTREESDIQDAKTVDACQHYLTSLSTKELFWLQEFQEFLLQDVDYTLAFNNDPNAFSFAANYEFNHHGRHFSRDAWCHHLLSASVARFGQWQVVMSELSFAPTRLEQDGLWLTSALLPILRERGAMTQINEKPKSRILESQGILVPTCSKCDRGIQGGFDIFYNKSNIEVFERTWDVGFLPGNLGSNPVEMDRIHIRLYGDVELDSNGSVVEDDDELTQRQRVAVLREILAHAEARELTRLENGESGGGLALSDDEEEGEEEEVPKDYKWRTDDPICRSCLLMEIRDLYYAWWLEERQTDRVPAHNYPEQCWWGYSCRTQRKHDHANKLDHCCPQTRGVIS